MRARLRHFFTSQSEMAKIVQFSHVAPIRKWQTISWLFWVLWLASEAVEGRQRPLKEVRFMIPPKSADFGKIIFIRPGFTLKEHWGPAMTFSGPLLSFYVVKIMVRDNFPKFSWFKRVSWIKLPSTAFDGLQRPWRPVKVLKTVRIWSAISVMVLHVKIGQFLPLRADCWKSDLTGRASVHSELLAKAGFYP